ncbi:HNH endonuclease signature motif containing protein [Vibrio furnissii]|uniref:HNH endonuclease signature motif containing protein n=1 Tax=Vibrio furnissii TaxID=29494 RepID=UPI001EEB0F2E|nr:HNH endonuclease signature motif containing protein [Vibrio furnissii]MCG6268283.1 HNH endonuclease [Vibrio furnissii]
MTRLFVTKDMKDWLTQHWPMMDLVSLTNSFNDHFKTEQTPQKVKATLKNYRIRCGREKGELRRGVNLEYTQEMIDFLQSHYPNAPVSDWIKEFNQTFHTDKNKCALTSACKRFGIKSGRNGQFKQGQTAHNKGKPFPLRGKAVETAFGGCRANRPNNKKPIGSTRLDAKDGYLIIKVSEPNIWRHAHVVLWEKHHGPVPSGHVVRFYDNAPERIQNPTIDNLFTVSRQVHARLTQMKLSTIPREHKDTMILIAKIEQEIKERTTP